jgi:hypothetical protein
MVRTTLILSLAMLAAVPASAAMLMDSIPDQAPQRAPAVPVAPGGPFGHVNIDDFENTIKGDIEFASLKNANNAPAPVADSALNVVAEPNVAAVPEPATWAMMLGGFGFMGFVIRRRALKTTASLSH